MQLEHIFNAVLTAALTAGGLALLMLAGWLLLYRWLKSRSAAIQLRIASFLTSEDPEKASPLATLVDQIAQVFAQRIVLQLKMTVNGMNSVDARNERKAQADELKAANPTLAAILNFIPGARRLARNPELLAAAAGALSKMNKGNGNAATIESVFKL